MARPFLAVPDTVTVPLKSPQEESRGDGEKEKGLRGSYLGHSVLSRHLLIHRKSASNCPPHLPTGTFLPTCYVRAFLRTPRWETHVQRYLAPREVGQDVGRADPHHHLWDLVTLRGRSSSFSPQHAKPVLSLFYWC